MAQIVTITNPLTGQPAQVDQLDHTAQEIDDAIARALPGGAIDTLLAGKVNGGKKTAWVTDSSSFSRGGVSYCRDDAGTVYVTVFNTRLTEEVGTWSSAVICTLPEGFRPTIIISVPLNHSYTKCSYAYIETNGQILIKTFGENVSASMDISFFISFPTA